MGQAEMLQYIWDTYGVEPAYLWARLPTTFALRNPTGVRWFASCWTSAMT